MVRMRCGTTNSREQLHQKAVAPNMQKTLYRNLFKVPYRRCCTLQCCAWNVVQINVVQQMLYMKWCTEKAVQEMSYILLCTGYCRTENAVQKVLSRKCWAEDDAQKTNVQGNTVQVMLYMKQNILYRNRLYREYCTGECCTEDTGHRMMYKEDCTEQYCNCCTEGVVQ